MLERSKGGRRRAGRRLGLLLAAWLLPALSFAVPVDVQGVGGELRDNIEAYVGKVDADDFAAWRSTRARLYESVRNALQSMGYYRADVDISQDQRRVRISVKPGQPVRVRSLRLTFNGEAGNDTAFTALRESLPLHEGDILHHGKYEALKTAVRNLGVERGYFDADWTTHEVAVDPEGHTADIELVYDSGTRYRFGPVRFLKPGTNEEQELARPELLHRLVTFEEGDPYDAGVLIKFNRTLLDTRYFNEVSVQAERDRAVDYRIPVDVAVAADKPNDLDIGLGYSTDVKARITLKWQRPLINEKGHGIEANSELSPVRSSFNTRYTIPLTHPLNDTLQYFYGVQREEVEEVVNWNTVLGLQRQIKRENGWQRIYSLRALRDTTELPDETSKKDLVLPGISLDRLRSRGGVDPDWGDRQFYQLEVASEQLLSDASLASVRIGLRLLRTLAGKHQFILRADGGTIVTDNFENVPQSMRFFAGGDQSVRGYGYRSISPRDADGVAVGARHLATGSVEYDYEFIPRWRLAVFTDAGNAFNSGSEPFKVGAGAGIRWVSPVGPIRLDLAWPVSDPDEGLRIHFSMGPNL